MRIKRVEAASVAEALRLIREELGDNALILHTKTLPSRGGRFAARVEVLGAVDEARGTPPPAPPLPATVREAVAAGRRRASERPAQRGVHEWTPSVLKGGASPAAAPRSVASTAGHGVLSAPFTFTGAPRRLAFVGPTGAGKTTTLAKVAARARLLHGRSVSLITVDTYRLGAVPQLTSYASILGVPLAVADTPDALAAALEDTRDSDLVLIDTAGRSPLGSGVDGLRPFIEAARTDDVCLVVGATTRPSDALRAAISYAALGPNRLCVTKLDETEDWSAIAPLSRETGLPLTWLGVGQEVPDDLEEAEPGKLEALLAGGAS